MFKIAKSFFLLSLIPYTLFAGGMTLYEISTAEMRLASAGWASRAQDPSTLFTNPAGMTRLDRPAMQAGVEALYLHAFYEPNSMTTVSGKKGDADLWLPSGSAFYVQPVNECFAFGVGSLGYFGSNLNCGKEWVGRHYFTKIFLEGFGVVPAAAYQVTDGLSIGLGANVMYGIYDQHSAIGNALDGLPDGKMLLRHRHLTAGALVGILYEFNPGTRVGVQYLSPVDLKFNMVPNFKDLGPQLEAALKRTGVFNSKVKLRAKVPQGVMISAYHDLDCHWSVMVDAGWQQWSKFTYASIVLNDANSTTLTSIPKFDDTWHVAAGVEFRYNPCWTLSAGAAYDSSAVSNKNRPLNFPVGKQWRFGTGARWGYSENLMFDFCYELLWSGDLPVNANLGGLAGRVSGKWANFYTHFLSADLIWAF